MTNIIEISDELQMLKSQMEILTRTMSNKNLITDDMIRQTVENRIEKLEPSKTKNYLSLLISIVLFPALVLWMTIVKDAYSLPLGLFTVFMCWTTAYRTYEGMRLNTMETVHNGSILEVSEAINKMRQMYNRHKLLTYTIFFVWVGWFLLENYHVMLSSINDIILSSIIVVFVFGCLSVSFGRIERITRQTLRDIENYR